MDLASLNPEVPATKGATLHLVNPFTAKPLFNPDGHPITITLVGRDSRRFMDAKRKTDQKVRDFVRDKNRALEPDEIDEFASETLAASVLGWQHIRHGGDHELEFTYENAKHLFIKQRWVREQVDAFVSDRGNFWQEPSSD